VAPDVAPDVPRDVLDVPGDLPADHASRKGRNGSSPRSATLRASRCNGLREINRIGWALLQARASESFRRTAIRKGRLGDQAT